MMINSKVKSNVFQATYSSKGKPIWFKGATPKMQKVGSTEVGNK